MGDHLFELSHGGDVLIWKFQPTFSGFGDELSGAQALPGFYLLDPVFRWPATDPHAAFQG